MRQEDEWEGTEGNNPAKTHKVTQDDDEKMSYLDKAVNRSNTIRMRLSLRGRQKIIGTKERAKETKRICVAFLNGVCHFDDNAKLTTWKDFGPEAGIQELDMLSNNTIIKFLDSPRSGPLKG